MAELPEGLGDVPIASPPWRAPTPTSSTSASCCPSTTSGGTCGPRSTASALALEASPYSFEIIVVDDGSDDGSETDLPAIEGIRLIRHSQNRGVGRGPAHGTTAARGRVVVWTDVDMTYPNDEIPSWSRSSTAATTSSAPGAPSRAPSAWCACRPSGSSASWPAISSRRTSPTSTRGCGRSAATSRMQYVHHLPAGFSCVTTLTMSFLANGYSVKYVPIDYFPRAGTSKFHWWRDTKRYLLQVVRMTLSYNPLKVFLPLGAAAAAGRPGQARLRLDRRRLPRRHQHAADPARRAAGDHGRPARRPRGAGHEAADEVQQCRYRSPRVEMTPAPAALASDAPRATRTTSTRRRTRSSSG